MFHIFLSRIFSELFLCRSSILLWFQPHTASIFIYSFRIFFLSLCILRTGRKTHRQSSESIFVCSVLCLTLTFYSLFIFFCIWFMKSLKNIFVFLCIITLSSCGNTTPENSWLETKVLDEVTMAIPSTWPLISRDSQGVPNPSTGEIILAASATEPTDGFANNIVVLKKAFVGTSTSKEYTIASHRNVETGLSYYQEISAEDIVFLDEEVGYVYIYTAQYNQNTPKVNILQTSRICSGSAFTATLAVSTSVTDFTRYKELLSTFACKTEK